MHTYFCRKHFRAIDNEFRSSVGDIVLIRQLGIPKGHSITHQVEEVIYKNGAVVDPLTGKLCHNIDYSDQAANPNLEEYLKRKETEV